MAKRQKNRQHNGQKTEEQTTQWPKDRRTDNTMAKRRTDNTMAKRRTDNTMAKRRTDNTMVKRKGTKGETAIYKTYT
jgi:hypothetical protein